MFAFRSMNTEVTVTADDPHEHAIAAQVAAIFWQAERRFSRFRKDSELATLNGSQGPLAVSPELFDALRRACHYAEMTDGIFDPGVGADIVAFGYDRSFAPGALDRERRSSSPRAGRLRDLILDPGTLTVERPSELLIDLGGMIKGATVDVAAGCLRTSGAIDAGGDAVLRGRSPTGEPWLVEVEDPRDPSKLLAAFRLSDRAVATSAANRRRWRVGESVAHHLIDPRTRSPGETDLLQATVIAPTAELADVLAKTAFLLGEEAGRRFLERERDVGAVLVPRRGALVVVGAVDIRAGGHG